MQNQSMRLEVLFAFARDEGRSLAEREIAFVEELLEEHGFAPDRSQIDQQILQSSTVPGGDAVEAVRAGVAERYGESNVRRTIYSGGEFSVSPDVSVASIAIEERPEALRDQS